MKKTIAIAVAILPVSLYADTVFYAPSTYVCTSHKGQCICHQDETPYFQNDIPLQNDCEGMPPVIAKFTGASQIIMNGKSYASAHYVYPSLNLYGFVSSTLIQATKGNSPNWRWTPDAYRCDYGNGPVVNDPHDCPFVALNGPKKYR